MYLSAVTVNTRAVIYTAGSAPWQQAQNLHPHVILDSFKNNEQYASLSPPPPILFLSSSSYFSSFCCCCYCRRFSTSLPVSSFSSLTFPSSVVKIACHKSLLLFSFFFFLSRRGHAGQNELRVIFSDNLIIIA